jgi:predicted enzyme related to lactoylglutathione lyase
MATSRNFYCQLFGWTAAESSVDGYAMFYLGDRAVAGIRAATQAGWLPYVASDDADTTVALARENGGSAVAAPFELGDAARVAVIADPAHAALGVLQRRRFFGAQVTGEFGTMCWAELATRDPASAPAFYRGVFGWKDRPAETADGTPYVEWCGGDRVLAGMVDMSRRFPASAPPHWTVTMLVRDCTATAERVAELGGQVLLPPTALEAGTYAQLADDNGASFRIMELLPELLAASGIF